MIDHFLQSHEWREVMRAQKNEIIEGSGFFGIVRAVRAGMRELYIPRVSLTSTLYDEIEQLARANRVDGVRLDLIDGAEYAKGYRRIKDFQPSTTLIVDLSLSEDELLASFHQKTRYNIRLAQKKGVTVRIASIDEFEVFWNLLQKTYTHKMIRTHDREYYESIIRQHPFAYLVFAEYEGKAVVANMMIRHGNTVTYLHGGADREYSAVMAPYLIQWEEMLRAQADGYAYYDFWGIAPLDADEKHSLQGVTRFKKGFGGKVVTFAGTYQKAHTFQYSIFSYLQNIKRKIR